MGENAEIYERLRKVETDTALIKERLAWVLRFMWVLFPSGGAVGWALATIFGGK